MRVHMTLVTNSTRAGALTPVVSLLISLLLIGVGLRVPTMTG